LLLDRRSGISAAAIAEYDTLLYELADGVATVTLVQHETRIALSNELLCEIVEAF
jgi:enoyl-CoA hydratase/carnithine racemase